MERRGPAAIHVSPFTAAEGAEMSEADAVIVGGGHNGLVCAA
jgi:ribulose 1,5-bisphosphate synthetase/thiazole synthase